MARNFNGSSIYGSYATPFSSGNCTFSVWCNPNDTVSNIEGGMFSDDPLPPVSGPQNYYRIGMTAQAGFFQLRVGATFYTNVGSTIINVGSWAHICGTFPVGGTGTLYVNGSQDGTTTIGSPTGCIYGFVGVLQALTPSYSNGKIAHLAIWNTVLNANEAAALAKGVLPYQIRPGSLKKYLPLDGLASPEPDLSGLRNNATLTGSPPAVTGPPVTLFTPKFRTQTILPAAVTTIVPWPMFNMRAA